jgi:hypothetical protein
MEDARRCVENGCWDDHASPAIRALDAWENTPVMTDINCELSSILSMFIFSRCGKDRSEVGDVISRDIALLLPDLFRASLAKANNNY